MNDRGDRAHHARKVGWPLALLASLASLASGGCGADAPGAATQHVVTGSDDRKEVYLHESAWIRSYAEQATAALVDADQVQVDGTQVTLTGPTLGARFNLCPGQRFADQPSVARCAATLIDRALVVTSGDCVPDEETCARTRFVFNYRYVGPGQLHPITTEDVFGCHHIVASRHGAPGSREPNFAVVHLDRQPWPRFQPVLVRLNPDPLPYGEHVKIVGMPGGAPAKIDMEGNVADALSGHPYLLTSLDAGYNADRGAGVYEGWTYTLAGIHLYSQRSDFRAVPAPGGGTCNVWNTCPDAGCAASVEMDFHPVVDALCAIPGAARFCTEHLGIANDYCEDAWPLLPLYGQQQTLTGRTDAARQNVATACPNVGRAPDAFWGFTVAQPTLFYADAFNSEYPATVFLATCPSLNASVVQCGTAACGTGQGRLVRYLQPGTYRLGVTGFQGTRGRFQVHVQFLPAAGSVHAVARGARVLTGDTTGLPAAVAGTCGGAAGRDVTYHWVTCHDFIGGRLTATTCSRAAWNTVLHAAQGNSQTTFCSDDACGTQSRLVGDVMPGAGIRTLHVDGAAAGDFGPYGAYVRIP